jgi:hypothetical protein
VTENLNLGHELVMDWLIRQLEFTGFVTAQVERGRLNTLVKLYLLAG